MASPPSDGSFASAREEDLMNDGIDLFDDEDEADLQDQDLDDDRHYDADGEDRGGGDDETSTSAPLTPGGAMAESGSCFFADAVLDLEEAHGMAETPEPVHKRSAMSSPPGDGSSGMPAPPLAAVDAAASNTVLDALSNKEFDRLNRETEVATKRQMQPTETTTTPSTLMAATSDGSTTDEANTKISGGGASPLDKDMMRITSSHGLDGRETGGLTASLPANLPTYRPRTPRRPRDVTWAVSAILFVPLSLMLPFYLDVHPDSNDRLHHHDRHDDAPQLGDWYLAATSSQGRTATLLSFLLAYLATVALARILYRSMGGGDGDDARHLASDVILSSNPVAFSVNPTLAALIYWKAPGAWPIALLPLTFFFRDILVFREHTRSAAPPSGGGGGGRGGASGGRDDDGRRTFFRALVCMALDILSRSLRRQSFYRAVSGAMLLQLGVVVLWRTALFRALAASGTFVGNFCVLLSLVGGKWATGCVARVLGLLASGGVTSWFAQQSILIEEMEAMKAKRREAEQTERGEGEGDEEDNGDGGASTADTASDDYPVGYDAASRAATRAALHEAYRATDASAYASVIDFDEGIDDDFEDDDEDESGGFVGSSGTKRESRRMNGQGGGGRGRQAVGSEWTGGGSGGASTVKSFLFSAFTVSFGSVAQCGLLGGTAQFVWSVVRNVDAAGLFISRRFSSSRFGGFRGMDISSEGGGSNGPSGGSGWKVKAAHLWNRADTIARAFVRSHSDLALSHVAAYFKSYQRAANDVAALIDASGVEPIIHDDITTHMCSSVCSAISGLIIIFIGFVLSHHRGGHPSGQLLTDASICEIMLLAFIMCYTIVFTVMEPLRASIKAVYVCFAQHPQSLSQAFPLIFHRLSRISEANVV